MYIHCIYKYKFILKYFVYTYLCPMAKDENILIRVSLDEKKVFKKAAKEAGLSVSAWIRHSLIELCKKK